MSAISTKFHCIIVSELLTVHAPCPVASTGPSALAPRKSAAAPAALQRDFAVLQAALPEGAVIAVDYAFSHHAQLRPLPAMLIGALAGGAAGAGVGLLL